MGMTMNGETAGLHLLTAVVPQTRFPFSASNLLEICAPPLFLKPSLPKIMLSLSADAELSAFSEIVSSESVFAASCNSISSFCFFKLYNCANVANLKSEMKQTRYI